MIESKRPVLAPLKHLASASDSSSAAEEQLSLQPTNVSFAYVMNCACCIENWYDKFIRVCIDSKTWKHSYQLATAVGIFAC